MVTAYRGQMASGVRFERGESVFWICVFLVCWGLFKGSEDVVEWFLGSD